MTISSKARPVLGLSATLVCVAVWACSSQQVHVQTVKARANLELSCPDSKLKVTEDGIDVYTATGCQQSRTYQVVGDCTTRENCTAAEDRGYERAFEP